MSKAHGFSPRTGDLHPLGPYGSSGKYGRMFPSLPPFRPDQEALEDLGNAMSDKPEEESGDNRTIPAGYTYLAQFIDHDITFDPTSIEEIIVDPLALYNYRTPKLDLDSVYGGGPVVQPYLYQRAAQNQPTPRFAIGSTKSTQPLGGNLDSFPNDLPRSSTGFALIGDARNDENLNVAQLHLAFLKFHNKVAEQLDKGAIVSDYSFSSSKPFEVARKIVVWHYQWLVLYDFLPRILKQEQLNIVLKEGRSFYKFQEEPFIPIEFSVAAFRLGHSMVRSTYNYNHLFSPPIGAAATLKQLFAFTGSSTGDHVPVPSNWIIDWHRFFEIDQTQPNFSRQIDPALSEVLKNLSTPDAPHNLAVRNLRRGWMVGLPSGQNIAKFMGLQPLTEAEISTGFDGKIARKHNFHLETPLWYYILKEAQIKQQGRCLGDVGSRILAEVFVGLLAGDSHSFLVQNRNWKPTLPAKNPGQFTIVDMLNFVNELNPIEQNPSV